MKKVTYTETTNTSKFYQTEINAKNELLEKFQIKNIAVI